MRASIVVITARADPDFVGLASAIQKSSHKECELIIVDRLKKERGDMWEKACEQAGIDFLHLIDYSPPGPCPASARNLGIANSMGDWIICLDDLTTFDSELISNHLHYARLGFDAIAGSYIENDGENSKIDPRTADPSQDSGKWIADRYYGMHMGFSKELWKAIGGFDAKFDGAYGFEDCDFGRRAYRAGFSVGWCPQLRVTCAKDSRHNLSQLSVGVNYKGTGIERTRDDEPSTIIYGMERWRNDKLILLNDKLGVIHGGYKHEE